MPNIKTSLNSKYNVQERIFSSLRALALELRLYIRWQKLKTACNTNGQQRKQKWLNGKVN